MIQFTNFLKSALSSIIQVRNIHRLYVYFYNSLPTAVLKQRIVLLRIAAQTGEFCLFTY